MPSYDYICPQCANRESIIVRREDADGQTCAMCGEKLTRLPSVDVELDCDGGSLMSKFNDGPTFPETDFSDEQPVGMISGMSLRDYFAAHALSAIVAEALRLSRGAWFDIGQSVTVIAGNAYVIADAMIRERNKP